MWPRPLRTTMVVFACAVVLAGVAACAGGSADHTSSKTSEPTEPTGASSTVPSCGKVPESTGPAAHLVTVRTIAPATAAAGGTIEVQAVADVSAGGRRIITVPAASRLLINRNGAIVAMSDPAPGPAGVPLPLTAGSSRPLQAVPSRITLVGCRGADGSPGTALPPGTYDVVAVLAYGQDPLQGAAGGTVRRFSLVSSPSRLIVQ
jgi:hypothetical protein